MTIRELGLGKRDNGTCQPLQPPAIRLFDLHVRVNASVKSGIQLLLLEQGQFPEMFRLEFSTKRLAKE